MTQSQPFNATNAPDTCLWCGRKLRVYGPDQADRKLEERAKMYAEAVQEGMRQREQKRQERVAKHGQRRGDYGDGFFCGLRCSYEFAVTLAGHGRRLQPKAEAK